MAAGQATGAETTPRPPRASTEPLRATLAMRFWYGLYRIGARLGTDLRWRAMRQYARAHDARGGR